MNRRSLAEACEFFKRNPSIDYMSIDAPRVDDQQILIQVTMKLGGDFHSFSDRLF
jgi:hypothetical protein